MRNVVFAAALLALLCARPGGAHDVFEVTAAARLFSDRLELVVTMSRDTALLAAGPAGSGRSLADPSDFPAVRPRLLERAGDLFALTSGTQPLALARADAVLTAEHDVEYRLVYPRPGAGLLRIRAAFLEHLEDAGYGAALSLHDEANRWLGSKLLTSGDPAMELSLGSPAPGPVEKPSFARFLTLGIEHILTGYDHLLFLGGLLVACRRLSSMLWIITSFTVAHSISLGLAALEIVPAPGRLVEPLIAASIVFVGVENLLRREEPRGRWRVTFAFGLIHGLGFAGALKQSGLGSAGAALFVPLVSFNLGVEVGQVAVAALVLPPLLALRRRPGFVRHVVPAISVAVALAGACWLVARTLRS